jgi:hypothetical protein
MPKACNLRFGLKNEMAKMDKMQIHSEIENGLSNEHETNGNSSHMAFGCCVSCQTGGNELASEIPILPSLEKLPFSLIKSKWLIT